MNFLAALLFSLTSYGITDGDTLRSGQLKVRLWGIDAPERHTAAGRQATRALQGITGGQALSCDKVDTDRYGRTVARCLLPNGTDIACAMVYLGHARDWPKYSGGHYAQCVKR